MNEGSLEVIVTVTMSFSLSITDGRSKVIEENTLIVTFCKDYSKYGAVFGAIVYLIIL